MNLPLKPDVAVVDGRLAVFIGADYKLLELPQAEALGRLYQSKLAQLRRQIKRERRAAKRALA